jgi:hypothetical protein
MKIVKMLIPYDNAEDANGSENIWAGNVAAVE